MTGKPTYEELTHRIRKLESELNRQKQAKEAQQTEHAGFVAAMNSLDAAVYAADMKTYELIFANKRIHDIFGSIDIIGQPCWKVLQGGQPGPCVFCTNEKLLDQDGKPTGIYVWEFRNTVDGEWYSCRDQAILWPDGRMARLEIATNITQRKRAERILHQRERYLTALNDAAESLLVPSDKVPIQEFVDTIGPASNASRVYIFLNHLGPDGDLRMSQKAEWCAECIPSEIANPILQNLSYDEWMPHWKDRLLQGKIVMCCAADYPSTEREILEPQGIMAILLLPILIDGKFAGFIGFDNCLSEHKWDIVAQSFLMAAARDLGQAIKRVRSAEQLRNSLKEKEVLLREIHHRVKNNMQLIVSLLRMHSRRIKDTRLEGIFNECRDRVNAMSLIHEALYHSRNLARIDFQSYLKKLCRNLSQAHGASGKGIVVTVDHCNVSLNMDQGIAVGMVISELITNAFKHAFPLKKGGWVSVSLCGLEGMEVELIVQDNGKGLPREIDIMNSPSLGLQLATAAVTRELNGSIKVVRDSGTRFIIHFTCRCK